MKGKIELSVCSECRDIGIPIFTKVRYRNSYIYKSGCKNKFLEYLNGKPLSNSIPAYFYHFISTKFNVNLLGPISMYVNQPKKTY